MLAVAVSGALGEQRHTREMKNLPSVLLRGDRRRQAEPGKRGRSLRTATVRHFDDVEPVMPRRRAQSRQVGPASAQQHRLFLLIHRAVTGYPGPGRAGLDLDKYQTSPGVARAGGRLADEVDLLARIRRISPVAH